MQSKQCQQCGQLQGIVSDEEFKSQHPPSGHDIPCTESGCLMQFKHYEHYYKHKRVCREYRRLKYWCGFDDLAKIKKNYQISVKQFELKTIQV